MQALHQRFPANTSGRDFVVSDLHGCRDLLQEQLDLIKFDISRDRLFSVGDLADRGPDSMDCLRLLREPWFHAVRGNHEDMLIDYAFPVGLLYAYGSAADLLFSNGGCWVLDIGSSNTQVHKVRKPVRQGRMLRCDELLSDLSAGAVGYLTHTSDYFGSLRPCPPGAPSSS
ncbi:MAG: metallophosphoesterase [Castellaniella sp.]|uniref:metallophosphoesterase n=1 Tax=Castellaniella sp. TaxID=1955812 RepID=UPI003C7648D7